ncbi:uncharacterized protein LOC126847238 [Adelges cooleyi]|uniref:uncharacterized protein LOC126847238 n=1 Tax=Adelges cooleyi TaxID=133065 RepID=UPI00217F7C06|nr:uncharacterized protein LOC126847238 [Adelges cooleyi]XP_050443355.1 uncharacterized protein LOC126847238 [Adelges cooleyi]
MADMVPDGDKDKGVRSRSVSQDEGSRLLGEPYSDGFCQRIKPKVSLCLGTTAALSFMMFLFLVPFVVDPAVSRLIARYSPEPGTCALQEHVFSTGLSRCTWSSCKEGCTSASTRCHQITVNYSITPYQQYTQESMAPESLQWAGTAVQFLVNTEGCGYPPFINCTKFARKYGYIGSDSYYSMFVSINQSSTIVLYRHGNTTIVLHNDLPMRNDIKVFPCYYSRAYPDKVVAEYDWYHTVKTLVAAVAIPWTLFIVSCAVLCCWYCPALKKEFMMQRKRKVKTENPQLVIRRKLSTRPFSTDEEDDDY